MKQVIVNEGQSWFDVAVQELGTVEGVFGLMGSADVLSDDPGAGRLLKITDEELAREYEPVRGGYGDVRVSAPPAWMADRLNQRVERLYKNIRVLQDQSWFDVAVQELGSVEGVFGLMGSADVLSDYPEAGRLLKITEEVLTMEFEPVRGGYGDVAVQRLNKRVRVLQDQSWFDVAVQEMGSVEGVFGLMERADVLNENPVTGRLVKVMEAEIVNKNNAGYFEKNGLKPCTGLLTGSATGGGIGYWTIGVDFMVG